MSGKRNHRGKKSKVKQPKADTSKGEQSNIINEQLDTSGSPNVSIGEHSVSTEDAAEGEWSEATTEQLEDLARQADDQDDPNEDMKEKGGSNKGKGKGKQQSETVNQAENVVKSSKPRRGPTAHDETPAQNAAHSNAHPHPETLPLARPATYSIPPVCRPASIFRRRRWGWPRQTDNALVPIKELKDLIHKVRQYSEAKMGESDWDALKSYRWLPMLEGVCAYAEKCAETERKSMTNMLHFLRGITTQEQAAAFRWPMHANEHWSKHLLSDMLVD
jgi:hypothetical protein